MVEVVDKHKCCGCAACVQVCPKQCISFNEDEQGFRYPSVDRDICVNCGLCERVCPIINQDQSKKPLEVYAAKNPNEEIRMKSSSGGIFTMLAETIIDQGGVVFGARFDENWEVEHAYTEIKDGLESFRGSKYVQSRIGKTYQQANDFLKSGRKVLFTGTPCQIAGLKKFLKKDYENLFAVDVVCHGVPSPLVWRTYLKEFFMCPKDTNGDKSVSCSQNEKSVITGISFRDKSTGWKKYGFIVYGKSADEVDENSVSSTIYLNKKNILLHETLDKNLYMQVFLKDLCLRPSCYDCPAKSGKSGSDLTIADFWGISNANMEFDDDKGVSLVMVNTHKGNKCFSTVRTKYLQMNYDIALNGNPSIEKSVLENQYISLFWNTFLQSGFSYVQDVLDFFRPSLMNRICAQIKIFLKRILPHRIIDYIKNNHSPS